MVAIKSLDALFEHPICPSCLGRCFAKIGFGLTNLERGELISEQIRVGSEPNLNEGVGEPAKAEFIEALGKLEGEDNSASQKYSTELSEPGGCWLCEGLMSELESFAEILYRQLKDYDFDNFLVGSKIDSELLAREESLWLSAGLSKPESIKAEINREVGKILNSKLGKPTEFSNPDIVALIDTRFNSSTITPSPLFVYGRYQKLARGIPQTKWFCRKCRGKGCKSCDNTGKMYETSVEELIAAPLVESSKAGDFALHGMGREDIDVMMLGNGRPFIMELSRPVFRRLALTDLESEINARNTDKISVENLRISNREEMIAVKSAKIHKTYRCQILAESAISNEKLKMVVNTFVERVITQKTPIRVLHRRADKYRKRLVLDCTIESHNAREFVLDITGESGIYIKELIHGDENRTQPNLSSELEIPCKVLELDVIRIHDENFDENRSE
jgi:tRNA pseudouridine synthase 10